MEGIPYNKQMAEYYVRGWNIAFNLWENGEIESLTEAKNYFRKEPPTNEFQDGYMDALFAISTGNGHRGELA